MKTRGTILIAFGLSALLSWAGWCIFAVRPMEPAVRVLAWERFAARSLSLIGMKNNWTTDIENRAEIEEVIRLISEAHAER